MMTALSMSFKYFSSQEIAPMSKWLVGSSSKSRSASSRRSMARATRDFCPPDRVEMSLSKSSSVKPRPIRVPLIFEL